MIRSIGDYSGEEILEAKLECNASEIYILNYGCVIRDWKVLLEGKQRSIVLGFDDFASYPEFSPSFGIIAGRVANRICNGHFLLDGVEYQLDCNNGVHHLHGGRSGLGKRVWNMEKGGGQEEVILRLMSPDGDQGYPGDVDFEVIYRLDEAGLHCQMKATTNRRTPVNLAQHNYYNLNGTGDILSHRLMIDASHYMPVDAGLIPTGEFAKVDDTKFDFRNLARVGERDGNLGGLDHNFILNKPGCNTNVAARLISSDEKLMLEIITDQRGIQLFTAALVNVPVPGLAGRTYSAFSGLCLEPQNHPDTLNHPDYDGYREIFCTPIKPYYQSLEMRLSVL